MTGTGEPRPMQEGSLRASFVIVGTQRTGSSALADRLGRHPEIACGWEWTERVRWDRRLTLMERGLAGDFSGLPPAERVWMARCVRPETRVLGFRRLFGASARWLFRPSCAPKLWWDRLEAHLRWFASNPGVRIVHVVRRNDLAWLKSKYAARASGAFVGRAYPEELKVVVPVKDALARLASKAWVDRRLGGLNDSNPYLLVEYERFAADPDAEAGSVVRFLGCNPADARPGEAGLQRQSTRDDADYVQNFEELARALERNGYRSGWELPGQPRPAPSDV